MANAYTTGKGLTRESVFKVLKFSNGTLPRQ